MGQEPLPFNDDNRAGGRINSNLHVTTATFGFALYWVWIWVMNRSALMVIAPDLPVFGVAGYRMLFSGAMVVALAALCPFCTRDSFVRPLMAGVAVAGTAGMLLLGPIAFYSGDSFPVALRAAGWILSGVGSGGCLFLWVAYLFSLSTNNRRLGELVVSAFVASVLFLAISLFELKYFIVVISLVPIASVLLFVSHMGCYSTMRKERSALPPRARTTIWRIFGSLFIFATAFGVALATSLRGSDYLQINRISFYAIAVVFLLIILIAMFKQIKTIFFLYKFAAPIVIIGFTLLPLTTLPGGVLLPCVVVSVGWRIFDVIIFLIMLDVIERLNLASLTSFAISRIVMTLGALVGQLIAQFVIGIDTVNLSLMYVSAVAVIVLIFTNIVFLDIESFKGIEVFFGQEDENESMQKSAPVFDTLDARCHIIATQYNLTSREEEILLLLARGRDAKYIEDSLCISNSTVKVHRHNIYHKLDVHSRQELLNIIEDTNGLQEF